ncbi:alpha/beta hydrolase [Luteibacter pinisoli]|uniref:Alpha/beta hydrolase n=2 Tax=Luteibacter pinisoli TaxID=2589080 RepID=A0A4Y5ZBJ3_9GAMM|nr:alpha/beta hydrolase [Luteibacter pinisoli]
MRIRMLWAVLACLVPVAANAATPPPAKNVVLVHGAFADGSSWAKVIPLLEAKGLHVVAVQNPLTSLKDDAAAATRAIEQADGPVVLVGHSWGGAVISEAGNNPKVRSLVYVAAFAPDNGQSLNDVQKGLAPPVWASVLKKDAGGFLTLPADTVAQHFAQDLPAADARLIAATQGPWFAGCLADKVSTAAWHNKPVWYVLASDDHMIAPSLQASMAKHINAKVTTVKASHVPMLSHPAEVAAAIEQAASGN